MECMISDLCMNEIDGCCFIEWRTLSNFEYHVETGSAVQILSKSGICYKGIISNFNEFKLYLKTNIRIGSPQVAIAYGDIINIELLPVYHNDQEQKGKKV